MDIDSCASAQLKPYNQALEQILASVTPLTTFEYVNLENCIDRILSEDLLSQTSLPAWNCSAMDGYAINSEHFEIGQSFNIVGAAFAGHPYPGTVGKDQCIKIMTGASLPENCDAVIMKENVQINGDVDSDVDSDSDRNTITINVATKQLQNVRMAGSEIQKGEVVLRKGLQINPIALGVIATLGILEVPVYRKVKVSVFSTGDELVKPGKQLQVGQIYDSNRYSVTALCQRLGCEVTDLGLIKDDQEAIKEMMLSASENADMLITSGGVSVGEADYVKSLVEEIGHLDLWKVAIKPGKPIAVGSINNCAFFGLPGNPVSAMVTLNILVQPAIQKLSGMSAVNPIIIQAICDSELKKKPGRKDYQRGLAYKDEHDNWHVSSTGAQGSAKLTSLSEGNCYIVLEQEKSDCSIGESVNIQLFDHAMI